MFTTNIIHFLQQFDHPIFHAFMVLISALGITPWVITVIIGITFAIDFKKGLVLINIVAWTAFFTVFLKEEVNYPRPAQLDINLKFSQYDKIETDYSQQLPAAFYEGISEDLLKQTRPTTIDLRGFPSGHTSAQVALWIGLVFLFKRKWMLITGVLMVILTSISRMYLGSHFLGDVLAGLLIGVITSFALIFLVRKTKYMEKNTHDVKSLSFLWLPLFLIIVAPFTPHWLSGSIIGLNLAAILTILQRNFPVFHIIIWKRVAAAAITLILFLIGFYFIHTYQFSKNDYLDIILIAALTFAIIRGSLSINRRLHFIRFRY